MAHNPEFPWKCAHDVGLACPPEGCPQHLGCARLYAGWQSENETPRAYQGLPPHGPEYKQGYEDAQKAVREALGLSNG